MGKIILYITYGIFIGLLAGGVIWITSSNPRGEPVGLLPTPTPELVTVYISGAVVAPGLYSLPLDSRVADVVDAAGGFSVNAQQEQVNLALVLTDGMQVHVPGGGLPSHISAGRVNINTATSDELETLPGIGPTTAQNIIDFRLQNGPFQVIQDIENVPGIGPATYERIKDYITVGQ
ncbi:MAG: ComEA family DNA-binding protein [Chloroflexota bacterium]